MRVPLDWLREYCAPGLDVKRIEERLTMTGTKVEAIHRHDAEDGRVVEVLELEITPNRPDCLGVYGVARELHAATGAPLEQPPWSEDPGSAGQDRSPALPAEVSVECPDLCPRFTARVFETVTIAPSPPWLGERLTAAGQRPINNVVDITNYAMLLTGQPLHAFDLDRVAGTRLTVRRAAEGEQVQTLDGETRTLDGEMVVIADADGPTSIAGLMGGARSEVGPDTRRVLLEVANWHGPNIHRSSWALGLRSEASSRFEKGLAPEQCMWAQAVASRLMIELCGAQRAARDDRHRRRWSGAIRDQAARGARTGDPRHRDPAHAPGRDPERAGLRHRRDGRRPGRDPAAGAARGRHARGRPDRGGRADRRAGAAARDAAQAPGGVRPALA